MDTMTTLKKWEDEAFSLVTKVESPMVRYTDRFAERAAGYVPTRPTFMAEMPKVGEMVEFVLKLEHRIVGEQTRFVHSMMKAMDPMIVKFETLPEHATTHPAKMAPRRTVKAA